MHERLRTARRVFVEALGSVFPVQLPTASPQMHVHFFCCNQPHPEQLFTGVRPVTTWRPRAKFCPSSSPVSMQFSDVHAGCLDTGLRLRNPGIPSPTLISGHVCHISSSSPVHLVQTVFYQVFQVGETSRKLRTQLTLTLHQCKGMYSPRCATHLPPVKICSSFHSRDVALNWL